MTQNPMNYISEMFEGTPAEQKMSIINLLMGVSNESESPARLAVLNLYIDAFRVSAKSCNARLEQYSIKGVVDDLKQLDKSEKEFLTVAVYDMLIIDGKPSVGKLEETLMVLEGIGISQEMFMETMDKMAALKKHFGM